MSNRIRVFNLSSHVSQKIPHRTISSSRFNHEIILFFAANYRTCRHGSVREVDDQGIISEWERGVNIRLVEIFVYSNNSLVSHLNKIVSHPKNKNILLANSMPHIFILFSNFITLSL